MSARSQRPRPPGKSKTDLRRGQFTPGQPFAKKVPAPRGGTATSIAEQALLFGERNGSAK
jgi:hypothetical protein